MKDTLVYIVSQTVDHPDAVVVDETTEQNSTILTLHVHPDDIGRVIGKSGRIIRAIRDLIKLIAAKHETYVDVVLGEENVK